MSAVFSQTEKEKRWPLTKDSCQSDGVLTLGSPMSSDRGDKCLANQHAMKSQAFPGLTPTREVTTCADFQRAGSNRAPSLPSLLAAQFLHGALVLLERPKPMEYC